MSWLRKLVVLLVIIGTAMLPFTGEDAHAMSEAHHHEGMQQASGSHDMTFHANATEKAGCSEQSRPSNSQRIVPDGCCGICVADVTVPAVLFTEHHPFTPIDGPAFSAAPNFPDLPSPPPKPSA